MKVFGRRILGKAGLSRFLQWRFNTFLMRWVPLALTGCYLSALGKLYFLFNSRERGAIEGCLRGVLRHRMTQGEMDEVVQRTFKGIFAHYHEKLFMAYTRFKKTCRYLNRRVAVEGCELLDEALARGRGVILVTGHYGAVEFLPLTLALKGYPVTMLLRFKTRQLKEILNRKAENVPVTLVDVSAEENVVFTALKALRKNQILITECDEFECWKPHRSETGRFLGSEVRLDRSLDMLQGRSGAPVCMGLVCREGSNRFSLKLRALDTAVEGKKALNIARQALGVLEQQIYRAPDQWYQWKEASRILDYTPLKQERAVRANRAGRHLPVADTPVYACPA